MSAHPASASKANTNAGQNDINAAEADTLKVEENVILDDQIDWAKLKAATPGATQNAASPNAIDEASLAELVEGVVATEAEQVVEINRGSDPRDVEINNLKDQLLRTIAEMENLRRRTAKEVDDTKKYAAASLAKDFLSVADNIRRALDSVPQDHRTTELVKGFYEGVELVERELLHAFEKNRILPIQPLNQRFDPKLHEAMFEAESAEHLPGSVMFVHEKGYVIADRLLRPAKVGVAKAPAGHPKPDSIDRQV